MILIDFLKKSLPNTNNSQICLLIKLDTIFRSLILLFIDIKPRIQVKSFKYWVLETTPHFKKKLENLNFFNDVVMLTIYQAIIETNFSLKKFMIISFHTLKIGTSFIASVLTHLVCFHIEISSSYWNGKLCWNINPQLLSRSWSCWSSILTILLIKNQTIH